MPGSTISDGGDFLGGLIYPVLAPPRSRDRHMRGVRNDISADVVEALAKAWPGAGKLAINAWEEHS
jgi:hypothetical protein